MSAIARACESKSRDSLRELGLKKSKRREAAFVFLAVQTISLNIVTSKQTEKCDSAGLRVYMILIKEEE